MQGQRQGDAMGLDVEILRETAARIRQRNLIMIHEAGGGHTGGDLSAADVVTTLYLGSILNVDPHHPRRPDRDRFFLSKGHSAALLYTVLAFAGFFPKEELRTFMQPLSRLSGHPSTRVPGVEANTGALGHGLPIAVGAALGARMDCAPWRAFVLTGDGELQEGSNWEAAMTAPRLGLDNLTVIVDRNGLQLTDWTENIAPLEPLVERWRAFGWAVREVDGHDHAALLDVFHGLPFQAGRPNCVIARTHKGQGVSFMRDRACWHHRVPTDGELAAALDELSGAGS
jgi:transketolase